MALAWLTPDALPTTLKSCVISFPDSEEFHSLVRGALFLLSDENNWEEFGSLTVRQTADSFRDMLVRFFGDDCMPIPAGAILEYAGSALPSGFLWADGALVSRTTYASLFASIGTTFGAGNGTTTFQLPDRRGKVGAGKQTGDTDFNPLGKVAGEKNHTLSIAEMPSHSHPPPSGNNAFFYQPSGTGGAMYVAGTGMTTNGVTGSTGGGGGHNNLQPYLVLNYIIKF